MRLKILFSLTAMISTLFIFACTQGPATPGVSTPPSPPAPPAKIKVLVVAVNPGHSRLYNLFKDSPDIDITEVAEKKLPAGTGPYDRPDLLDFDVVYLYDLQSKITEQGKSNFLKLFDKGVGLMVVHDALLSYQDWPDYERISGGTYLLSPRTYGDKKWPESSVGRNIHIDISVTDKDSPVAAGISDFFIKDEIYRGLPLGSDIHTVFSAENKPLIWTRQEKNSRVFTCIIGHGPGTWNVPEFQKILGNALHWVAKRPN